MDYNTLGKGIEEFQNTHKKLDYSDYSLPYQDWYWFRKCMSHQKSTTADEVWFANQVGGGMEGVGKQHYEHLGRTADFGDGYIGKSILVGVNNYDLKVDYRQLRDTTVITSIGFQQYRPADPIAFYTVLIGHKLNYTLFVIPNEVALNLKINKIARTGKLGSAHGTGLYDNMTTEEKVEVLTEAKKSGKSAVLSFQANRGSDKEDFELLMDNYCMRMEDVADFISTYKYEV